MAVRRREPPTIPQTLNEIIRMIASLDGYVSKRLLSPASNTLA
jgi:hypothetical protein